MSDFAGMFRFYRDVVGLKPQFDGDEAGSGPYAAFKPDNGSTIALHARAALAAVPDLEPASGDRAPIALRIDDLDGYEAITHDLSSGRIVCVKARLA